MRILVSGATGFIGSELVPFLRSKGHQVFKLVRNSTRKEDEIFWNPYQDKLEQFSPEAVVHLSGESVATLWTASKKKSLLESRTITTKFLAESLRDLKCGPPSVCLFSSGINFYYDRNQQEQFYKSGETPLMDENFPEGKQGFLTQLSHEWEESSKGILPPSVRVITLRISVILGRNGGILGKMGIPFKLGLGGVFGSGKQYMSWMHIEDFLRASLFMLENKEISGAVNMSSPSPISNYEFTKTMGSVLFRPTLMWVPTFVLKASSFLLGEFADETLLCSLRVFPKKLIDCGFKFKYPDLLTALNNLFK